MTIKRILLHIMFATLLMPGMASCVYESEDCPDPSATDDLPRVRISFSVVAPSAANPPESRTSPSDTPDYGNYFENGTQYELIKQLRVIILRPDGEVEQNRLVKLDNGSVIRYDNLDFMVYAGERKKIYILANAENLGYNFDALTLGSYYVNTTMEDIIIDSTSGHNSIVDNTGSTKRYIPMSEVHEVMIEKPETLTETVNIGPLFITRAAVKFSFEVSSEDNSGLYLKEITLNKIADKEFFIPRDTRYSPPKGSDPVLNWSGAPQPDLYGRFITEFATPSYVSYSTVNFSPNAPLPLKPGEPAVFSPAIYFCESKFSPSADNPYSVSITVAEKDKGGNFANFFTFEPQVLTNLPILPRNTHVKVKIKIKEKTIQACEVDVLPYIGESLDPVFGIDRE